jgi:hypothetical protein
MDVTNEKEAVSALELLYLAKDRKALLEISNNQNISSQIRKYASGLLARPWLPWGGFRKAFMIVLFLGGIVGPLMTGSPIFLILILFALLFSPRLVAELLVRFSGNSRNV